MNFLMFDAHQNGPEWVSIIDLSIVLKGQAVVNHVVDNLADLVAEYFHLIETRPCACWTQGIPIKYISTTILVSREISRSLQNELKDHTYQDISSTPIATRDSISESMRSVFFSTLTETSLLM